MCVARRRCGEDDDCVARANDEDERPCGEDERPCGERGRTTVWRERTSKSHKKEIMSLLSFHIIGLFSYKKMFHEAAF